MATWADYWASLAASQNAENDPSAQQATAPPPPPSLSGGGAQSPYLADPTGTGPAQGDPTQENYGQQIVTHYNPSLFATDNTAQALAAKLGGQVISAPSREAGGGTPGSPWNMPDANYIRMPNGAIVNAGTLQGYLDNYGPDAGMKMVQQEIAGDTPQGLAAQGSTGADYWYNQYGNNPAIAPPPVTPPANTPRESVVTPPPASSGGTSLSGRGGDGDLSGRGANGTPPIRTNPTQPTQPSSGEGTSLSGRGASAGSDPLTGRGGTGAPPIRSDPTTPTLPSGGGVPPTSPPTRISPPVSPPSGGNPGTPNPGSGRGGPGITPPVVPPVIPPGRPPTGGTTQQPGFPGTTPPTTRGAVPAGYNSAFPTWSAGDGTNGAYTGSDPGYMAGALQNRAIDYGNTFENTYGGAYNDAQTQAQQYQNQSDSAYNWLNDNPGYNADEAAGITQQDRLTGAQTTQGEFDSNQLTGAEQQGMMGDAASVGRAFDPSTITSTSQGGTDWTKGQYQNSYQAAENALNQGDASTRANLQDYGTRLRATVDPSKLGISDETVSGLKDQAGRQIGLQYGAAQDQLQRQAEAAGNVNPLSLSAARDRLLRSSSIDQADAVTNADLSAREAQRQANVGIAGMQQSNENAIGNAGLNTNLSLAGLRTGTESAYGTLGASVGANANAQNTAAVEAAGNTAIQQAGYQDTANAARNAAVAQNRQATNQANQAAKYQQGYNTATSLSGANKAIGDARIQGQQAARNYWQGQGQYQGAQANAASASRISGAQTSLSGQGQGAQVGMGTEIGRRSTRPVSIGPGGITVGI